MSPYIVAPLLAVIAILQTSLAPLLPTGQVRPELMLLVVVGWGIVHGGGEAVLWGLGGGIMLDLLSGTPFGLHALTLGAIGLIADLMETNFFRANIFLPPAAAFIATFLYLIPQAAILQTLGYPINWVPYILNVVFPTAVLDAVLMPFVYVILRRADHVVRPRLGW